MTCAWLYNFIINEDRQSDKHFHTIEKEIDGMNLSADPIAPLEISFLPVIPDKMFEVYPGVSHTRESNFLERVTLTFCDQCIMWNRRRQC